jgi:hypothetical protein
MSKGHIGDGRGRGQFEKGILKGLGILEQTSEALRLQIVIRDSSRI